jgi:hypothetical protein
VTGEFANGVCEEMFALPDFQRDLTFASSGELSGFGESACGAIEITQGTEAVCLLSKHVTLQP